MLQRKVTNSINVTLRVANGEKLVHVDTIIASYAFGICLLSFITLFTVTKPWLDRDLKWAYSFNPVKTHWSKFFSPRCTAIQTPVNSTIAVQPTSHYDAYAGMGLGLW